MAYTPTNWQTGDIVSSERLNKLEKGVEDASVKVDAIEEELGGGGLEDLSVGTADQLLADTGITDKVPYVFRASDHNSTRLTEKVVGGTIAWNQLGKYNNGGSGNGITYTLNQDGSISISGTQTATSDFLANGVSTTGVNGHVIYIGGCPSGGSASTYYARDGWTAAESFFDTGSGSLFKKTYDTVVYQICIKSGTTVTNLTYKPQIFDLTQMFGSAVADQILAMETATAGAGVALFKSLFPKSYYAYNAGELMSVNAASHEMTGFNQLKSFVSTGNTNRYSVSLWGNLCRLI